jgi:ATP-dependent protease ClpP protease subunit
MTGVIHIEGVIGEDTNLIDVIRQVKAQKTATEFLVKIDSVGGYVDVGFAIYDYLKALGKPVTTYTTKSFSIASVIFMAGQKRIIPEGTPNAFMIHLPAITGTHGLQGTHDQITADLSELKAVEDNLVKFYSDALQLPKNTILSLLKDETFLDASKCLELGVATEIQPLARAVAMINNEKKEDESLMKKLHKDISAIYNKLFGIKAEMILQDATGVEVVFPDLNEGDLPEAGAKATIDGKPAEGEILMPDGSKMIFEAGVLSEILPAEEPVEEEEEVENAEGDEEAAPADDKDARIAELEKENEELKAKIAELEGAQASAEAVEEEQSEKMLAIVAKLIEKSDEQEAKYQVLAKSIGSDFNPEVKKENQSAVKASADSKSRAWQIFNS